MQILESGMIFGEYEPDHVFKIENSQMHSRVGAGVKTVEFILLKKTDRIFFVEAKSSSPRLENDWKRYQEFIDEISFKFVHSFEMFCAWHMNRLEDKGEMGAGLKTVACDKVNFIFLLVIRGHKKEWLLPLQEELNKKLRYHRAIWKSRIVVMNDETANAHHFTVLETD